MRASGAFVVEQDGASGVRRGERGEVGAGMKKGWDACASHPFSKTVQAASVPSVPR